MHKILPLCAPDWESRERTGIYSVFVSVCVEVDYKLIQGSVGVGCSGWLLCEVALTATDRLMLAKKTQELYFIPSQLPLSVSSWTSWKVLRSYAKLLYANARVQTLVVVSDRHTQAASQPCLFTCLPPLVSFFFISFFSSHFIPWIQTGMRLWKAKEDNDL